MKTAFSLRLMDDAQDAGLQAMANAQALQARGVNPVDQWSAASDSFARVASIAGALGRANHAASAALMAHKLAIFAECDTLTTWRIPDLPPLRVNVTA